MDGVIERLLKRRVSAIRADEVTMPPQMPISIKDKSVAPRPTAGTTTATAQFHCAVIICRRYCHHRIEEQRGFFCQQREAKADAERNVSQHAASAPALIEKIKAGQKTSAANVSCIARRERPAARGDVIRRIPHKIDILRPARFSANCAPTRTNATPHTKESHARLSTLKPPRICR